MDQMLPEGMIAALELESRKHQRKAPRHAVIAGGHSHPIVVLNDTGFVIRASEGGLLRGFVDIMQGETRLGRRLVVCAWEQDGLVGYEFKSESSAKPVAADYAPPDIDGYLEGPAD